MPPVQVSAQAWLELRSRVQAYQTPVRLLWVAGVWDALRAGKNEEARARCGLLMAQARINSDSGVMGGGIRDRSRGSTAHGPLSATPSAERERTAIHEVDRQQMVRTFCQQVGGHRLTERKEAPARCKTCCNTRCGCCTSSKGRSQSQRKRERERKGQARGRGSCRPSGNTVTFSDSFLHADTSAGTALGCDAGAGKGYSSSPCGLGADALKVPGASATTVSVHSLWNSATRWLLRSRAGSLRTFFHSSLQQTGRVDLGTFRPVWPIPLPFFHREEVSFFGNVPSHLQKGLTSMVICMNWLHLGQPYKIPSHFNPRERLSGEQRATIHRLLRLMTPWSESLPVIAADMGRTAAKVENVEMTIELLKRSTATAVARLGSSRETVGEVPEMRSASLLGEVQLAKKIESQRIKFAGRPSFDPSPLLDEASRKIYCNPLAQAMPPEESMQEPPRVNARGDRKEDCFVNSIIQVASSFVHRIRSGCSIEHVCLHCLRVWMLTGLYLIAGLPTV